MDLPPASQNLLPCYLITLGIRRYVARKVEYVEKQQLEVQSPNLLNFQCCCEETDHRMIIQYSQFQREKVGCACFTIEYAKGH